MLNQLVLFDILVFGVFFLGSKSSSICDCNYRLRSVCVGPSDSVFVPCPALVSEDWTLQLLQDQTVISSFCFPNPSSCNPAPAPSRTNQTTPNPDHNVSLTNRRSQRGFNLTVRGQSSHGLYVCEGKSMFPPPVRKEAGPEQVLVLVQGHQCDLKVDPRPDPVQGAGPVLVWIIAVACLSSYSLLISIVCARLWVKSRSSECERDYVNTKPPSTHRHQRKKRNETAAT
ncbi:uncharacterized protein [Eucyclogobius newberryi]|uniref:uncharacterized protein n=1 Tax=Eucyclogobius newberryi TaxID=166745 RepID=UPI003B5B0958